MVAAPTPPACADLKQVHTPRAIVPSIESLSLHRASVRPYSTPGQGVQVSIPLTWPVTELLEASTLPARRSAKRGLVRRSAKRRLVRRSAKREGGIESRP